MCDIDIHCLTHLRSILCRILTFCRVGTRVLTSDTEDEREQIREKKFESPADAELSNCSIGAEAPAAAFGKTASADFASAGYKHGISISLPRRGTMV